jgi:hypothetical protein
MTIGLLFWVLMVIALIFGFVTRVGQFAAYGWGFNWLLWILLFLLGWHAFGFIIHQ